MDVENEPLHKKWWAWIALFLITAMIVNFTQDYYGKTDADFGYSSLDDEAVPVIAEYRMNDNLDSEGVESTFLVGRDLPSGEYFVMVRDGELGYVLVTRNENLVPEEIIWQNHFENHMILTVVDGEYITTLNATLLQIESAIVPSFENGVLKAGTYRVGIDIPAGIYTIFANDGLTGYFRVATSSRQVDAHIVNRQNFNEPVIISLNDGDYLTMMRAEIRK